MIGLNGKLPKDGEYEVKFRKQTRTTEQNNAIHLFCQMLADELTEKHIDKREFFKEPFFLEWTKEGVKNDIWKKLQKSLVGKGSTTELDKIGEIDLIWDNINKIIIDKYDGEVITPPFPSIIDVINKSR